MFKSIVLYRCLRSLNNIKSKTNVLFGRHLSSSDKGSNDQSISEEILSQQMSKSDENESKDLSFAKAFEKFERLAKESQQTDPKDSDNGLKPFPTLLRYSPFIQLGDPEGKVVVGRVVDIVDDDLYIDFGHKFNTVCKRPKTNQSDFVRGAKVRLRINDLELSDRFLGSHKDMTLLEAEATLLGIIWSPNRSTQRKTDVDIENI